MDGHIPFVTLAFAIRIVEALGNAAFLTASFAIIAKEFPNNVATMFVGYFLILQVDEPSVQMYNNFSWYLLNSSVNNKILREIIIQEMSYIFLPCSKENMSSTLAQQWDN